MADTALTVLEVAKEVVDYLRAAWDARKECTSLRLEILSLEGVLAEIRADDSWATKVRALEKNSEDTGPLSQLEKLLADIKRALEKVVSSKGIKKLGHSLMWPFKQGEVDSWISAMQRIKATVSLALHNEQGKLSRAILDSVRDTKEAVASMAQRQEDQENRRDRERAERQRADILNWISPADYTMQQEKNRKLCLDGTGQWLLDSPEFQTWLGGDKGGTMFCEGIPGAGKSIISSRVIDYLAATFEKDCEVGVAYVYYTYDRPHEQQADKVLLALSKQLASDTEKLPTLPEYWEEEYNRGKGYAPSKAMALLERVVEKYSKVFLVIDALDECQYREDDQDINDRDQVLAQVANLRKIVQLYVFATSRPNSSILEQFRAYFGETAPFAIAANDQDIDLYINHRMSGFWQRLRRKPDEEIQATIRHKVRGSAQGMFLLAKLHMDSLAPKKNLGLLRDAIGKIQNGATSLTDQYDGAMTRILQQESDAKELALSILSWLTRAKRLLTISELLHVLAIKEGDTELDPEWIYPEEEVTAVCAGLVTVDPDGAVVRWIHYTTKDYFDNNWGRYFADADRNISITCITYMSFDNFGSGACEEFEKRNRANPLYQYAAKHLPDHLPGDMASSPLLLELLQKDQHVDAAAQALLIAEKSSGWDGELLSFYETQENNSFHLLACYGWEGTMRLMLEKGYKGIGKPNGASRTPLSYAAERGRQGIVQLMLATGDGIRVDGSAKEGRTPLSFAARNGHVEIARLLLERGAAPDAGYASGSRLFRTPLSYAASGGHPKIVEMLLGAGANVEAADIMNRTPLWYAALNGDETTIRILVDHGRAKCNTIDYEGTSALSNLADVDMVRLFLAKGANPDTGTYMEGNQMDSPLLAAMRVGNVEMVKVLLDTGLYPDPSEDWQGQSGLSQAAKKGHKNVVALLMNYKQVNVNSRCHKMWTPLTYAADAGKSEVVQILLASEHVEPDAEDSNGKTPLSHAATNGHDVVVELLLRHPKVDPNKKDKTGMSPLSWATRQKHPAVVELLLKDPRVNTDSRDERGRTEVAQAAAHGDLYGMQQLLLLNGDASAATPDFKGRTPLMHACAGGHLHIVQALLQLDEVDIRSTDNTGQTALFFAVEEGHVHVVEFLIHTQKVRIDDPDQDGRTPLSYAADRGRLAIANLLLAQGARPDSRDKNGRTPLSYAAAQGMDRQYETIYSEQALDYDGLVKGFLDQPEVNVNSADSAGRTVLWWAVWAAAKEAGVRPSLSLYADSDSDDMSNSPAYIPGLLVLKLLLARPELELNSRDRDGGTPLLCAVKQRLQWAVTLLLADNRTDPMACDNNGRSIVWWSVKKDLAFIFQLLLADKRLHISSEDACTALGWAARNGDEETSALVLKQDNLDPNSQDADGRTALSHAAQCGHQFVVQLLLADIRIDPNIKDSAGRTPLWWALNEGNSGSSPVADLLLADNRTDPAAMEANWAPLRWAAKWAKPDVVRQMLSHPRIDPDHPDEHGRTALGHAADLGRDEMVKMLLDDGRVDANHIDGRGFSPLFLAIKSSKLSFLHRGCVAAVKMLLEREDVRLEGAGPDGKEQMPPLVWAVEQEDPEIFMTILDRKVPDLNAVDHAFGRSALWAAAYKGKEDMVRALLAKDPVSLRVEHVDPFFDQTPLSVAAQWGRAGVVTALLESGRADKNRRDRWGRTPLILAAKDGSTAVVALLLSSGGIDVNAVDEDGRTALSHAAKQGDEETVALLLRQPGVDCNAADNEGRTALSYGAASWRGKAVVKQLLKAEGIEVDAADKRGRTPLSYAAAEGSVDAEVVALLLAETGVHVDSSDENAMTPLDYANKERQREAARLLIAAGAMVKYEDDRDSDLDSDSVIVVDDEDEDSGTDDSTLDDNYDYEVESA